MATVQTQIRIDEDLKKEASELFKELGLDMSTAINIFLRQCVLRHGLPFKVRTPQLKPEVIEVIEEAERMLKDPNTKTYESFSELLKAIEDEEV